jgi:hypothetical protein
VKKPEGKRNLGSLRSRLEDNIEKDLEEHVAFFSNMIMNIQIS